MEWRQSTGKPVCDCEREWVRMKWAVASLDAAITVPAWKGSFESEGMPGRLCDSTKSPALCGSHQCGQRPLRFGEDCEPAQPVSPLGL